MKALKITVKPKIVKKYIQSTGKWFITIVDTIETKK